MTLSFVAENEFLLFIDNIKTKITNFSKLNDVTEFE